MTARTAVLCAALVSAVSHRELRNASGDDHSWYVDCDQGDDGADGHSSSSAWKSLHAVSEHVFKAGDSIYLRRGCAWTGMLAPKGSGSAAAPIRLDAWGTGPLPRVQAETGEEAALKLFNQEHWTIEHIEFSGGQPHGIFISGTTGVQHGIHIRDVIIHDVTGQPKNKQDGLLVIAAGAEQQHFDDTLIDGVTAYRTSQWAGILIGGVAHGFPPESSRNTNVVIRNSIVHDVAGDGIVLFQVNNGTIENSVAWETGMQETETIGTPNAIWTWMCRNCRVRRNEAFLTDSPGVDGGAFDIDYGNDDNAVEKNYGHDTQGYCVAVFAAGWETKNSVVRNNICSANGLSPRLARRQGAIFLSTWNGGKIAGLEISHNRIFWNPPLATAAIVNEAAFKGTGRFQNNIVHSCSPSVVRSNGSLVFQGNSYHDCRRESPLFSEPEGRVPPPISLPDGDGATEQACPQAGRWCLTALVSRDEEDHDSRGQVAVIESVHHQFPGLRLAIVALGTVSSNLRYDWNTRDIPVLFDERGRALTAFSISHVPAVVLSGPAGKVVWRHEGFASPGELGILLRSFIGNPQFAELSSDQ